MSFYSPTKLFKRSASLILLIVGLAISMPAQAQNLGSIDFENLKSSDLSDAQVQRFWERAQEQGYNLQDVQQLAIARGMSPGEVSKLAQRVRQLKLTTGTDSLKFQNQLRRVARDSLLSDRQSAMKRDSADKKSRIFGANLFERENLSFAPSLNIPTPESYQLGAGDEIIIDIYGATDKNYQLTISPEGSIILPRVGPVYLNGLSIAEARVRLRNELSNIYGGLRKDAQGQQRSNVRISLGNIRSINVTVLGEATLPGTYTLPSLATAFNALYIAGGPDSTGTYRNIEIVRNGTVVDTLDVYDYLTSGSQPGRVQLRDQDVIKIGSYLSRIRVGGRFKRNGIFELRKNETIGDLVNYTGGFSEKAYSKRITLVRETPTELVIKDVAYPEQRGFEMQNGDSVYVGKILQRFSNRIQIEGAVFRPGAYELKDSTTVYSLLKRAEGVRGDAFLNRGLIYREREDLTTKSIAFSPRDILNNPAQNDIALKPNDLVVINSQFELQDKFNIRIGGAVQQARTYPYVYDMTLEDAILQSDGFDRSAAPYRVEVARRVTDTDSARYVPNEIAETFQFSVSKNLELTEKGREFTLEPYDQIFVRSSPAYFKQQNVEINGQVIYPGEYALKQQQTRISDIIEDAGGMTRFAYPDGANLTRENIQEINTAFLNIADSLETKQQLNAGRIKVGIELDEILANPGSEYDLLLRDGDVLEIPKQLQTVKISGEVLQPVGIRYEKGRSFRDYIRAAGGPTNQGERKDAYIVYANGEVDRASRFLFFKNYPDVKPGATIFVPPEEPDAGLTATERISIFSTILSTLAIVSNAIFR